MSCNFALPSDRSVGPKRVGIDVLKHYFNPNVVRAFVGLCYSKVFLVRAIKTYGGEG